MTDWKKLAMKQKFRRILWKAETGTVGREEFLLV